jgi:hypothetical protein
MVSGQLHDSAALGPGKETPGTHWIGGLVGPSAGLDDAKKRKSFILPGLELQPLDRPSRSQSLYQVLYPGRINYRIIVNPIHCDSVCVHLLPLHTSVS